MPKITIFTGTYNRAYIIEKLYRSLQLQSVFDFEWLVVNDGSTDNTDELFQKWIAEDNKFPIRYFKQENLGCLVGFNLGVQHAAGEYLCKIDSDDYITKDCVESLIQWLETIKGNKEIYAVGGMRGTVDGKPLKGEGEWPVVNKETGYVDVYDHERNKYNLDADMTEAWKVSVLKKYPFPEFEGEWQAPQEIVFFNISFDGFKIRWFPKIICICEYQSDGITSNREYVQKMNPLGYSLLWKSKVKLESTFKRKLYCLIQAGALALYSGKPKHIWKDNNYKFLSTMLLPFSFLIFLRRRKQFGKY